ncbi:MAG: S-layer homology domain-containing protein [Ruminococcaceae bacterium]|nr:S-layer homology domain-containing protein [Oscillospiraceae bacterium]
MKKIIACICTLAILLSSTGVLASEGYEVREEMAASYGSALYVGESAALQEYANKTGLHDFSYGYIVTYQGGFGGGGADASISVEDTQGYEKLVFDARIIADDFCTVSELNSAMYPGEEGVELELVYPETRTGSVRVSPHWDDEYSPSATYPEVSLTEYWQHYEMDIADFSRFRLYIDALGAAQGAGELCAVIVANVKLTSGKSSAEIVDNHTPEDEGYYRMTEPSDWAKKEVEKAHAYGIISENNLVVINFQAPIKREHFAQLIVNCITALKGTTAEEEYIAGIEEGRFVTFDDTASIYVRVAASLGIVNGVGDNMFAPEQRITRQEIAVMMHRAIKYMESLKGVSYAAESTDLSAYVDADMVADWATTAVGTLAANRIMNGTSDTTLSPLDNTTGEQAIALTVRIFEMMQ